MTNLQVWLYSIGIALVWLVVIAAATNVDDDVASYPTTLQAVRRKASSLESKLKNMPPIAEWAQQQESTCQNLCGHCNCRGFYCGEECICECNNENTDTECIARMQTNAKEMNIPFELLIQGPSSNRFVRNAMLFGQEMPPFNTKNEQTMRNKRSTVVIYKPEPETEANLPELQTNERFKRSSSQLDWLNDLTAALTRPAPINNKRSKTQSFEDSVSSFLAKRSPKLDFDNSWFTDNNSQGLLRPAPLSKRQNKKRRSESFDGSNEFPDAMSVVENIPRAIKNTLRSLQQENTNSNSNMDDDLNDFWTGLPRNDLRTKPAVKDTLKNDKAITEMQRWRDNLVEAFERFMENSKQRSSTSSTSTSTSTSTTSTTPSAIMSQQHGQLLVPQWFRPMRFLQRVSEVLNESAN